MITLSHKDARRWLHIPEQALSTAQQAELTNHLAGCTECRIYADELRSLQRRLTRAMHTRWDYQPYPKKSSREIQRRWEEKQMKRKSMRLISILAGISAVVLFFIYGPALLSSLLPVLNINPVLPSETITPLPIDPMQTITAPAPTSTLPAPTATQTTPTLAQPSPTPALEEIPLTCGSLDEPLCSVQQAEALAGFDVSAPTQLPDELTLSGAIATPGESTTQVYRCGEVCYLTIHQQILETNQDWVDARNHRGELVPVGSHTGLYYTNAFAAGSGLPTQPGDTTSATQVLQWKDYLDNSGIGLRISVYGSPPENSQLDREGLIELAYNTKGIPFPSGLIAFETNRDGNAEIYARKYFDQGPTNLTNHPAADHSFAWSPDGERIAFLSDRSGALEVFVMQSNGSNVLQLTQDSGVRWKGSPAWSPDGARLALTGVYPSSSEGGSLIYLVNVDGSDFSLLSEEPTYTERPLQWSPDGQWIVFTENFVEGSANSGYSFTGDSGLKAISLDGNRKLKLSGPENKIVGGFDWSPDGQTLAYAWMRDPLGDIYMTLANADGTEPDLASTTGYSARLSMDDLAWSPDGNLIAHTYLVEGGGASSPFTAMFPLYDFLAKETDSESGIGMAFAKPNRISWSPEGLQILFVAESLGDLDEDGIYAGLLEFDVSRSSWFVENYYILEESWFYANENTNPQWQPRP